MAFKLFEYFYPKITLLGGETVSLKRCKTYQEAYKAIEEYIEDMDDKLLDAEESIFEFSYAHIDKKFVREWD